jgi:hypothetical protein
VLKKVAPVITAVAQKKQPEEASFFNSFGDVFD